jgi:hypothetical protein
MKLTPVDDFVKEGFAKQVTEQFRCPAIYVTSSEKVRTLQTLLETTPSYPYIFLTQQTSSPNNEAYPNLKLAKQGVVATFNSDNKQAQLVRLLPTNFVIEITFITNKSSSNDLDSISGFIRRWAFARRLGYLNFTVNYGLTNLAINCMLEEAPAIPSRENPADQEAIYTLTTSATVHGYISEPVLSSRGIINQIYLADTHPTEGQIQGSHFFPF